MKTSVDFEGKVNFDFPSSIDAQPIERKQNAYASNGRVGGGKCDNGTSRSRNFSAHLNQQVPRRRNFGSEDGDR